MEYIIEFILELFFEGSIEASKSDKLPKYIRYPLIIFILLFFIAVIGLIFFTGALVLKNSVIVGLFVFLIGIIMLVSGMVKFRKMYLFNKKNNE